MDITITWANGGGYQPTDGWNVLYREHTPTNMNNWILATDPDLLPNVNQYTITGLTPNVIYDVAVVKSCASVFDQMSQRVFSYMSCPIVSTWQGPVVNGKPTLFYSVYYEEGTDIGSVGVRLYETTPQVFSIVDAIGNGTNILFATGSVHDLLVNSEVVVTGVTPAGYNGTYTIISKTASAFVVAGTNTGPFVSDGIVTYTPGMLGDVPEPRINSVVGKLAYQVINASQTNPINFTIAQNCGTDGLTFVFPNSTNSAAGYFGAEHAFPLTSLCDASISQNGAATTYDPILLDYNTIINPKQYKLGTVGNFDSSNFGPNPPLILGERCPGDSITTVTTSFTFDDDSSQPYRNLNVANSANISAAICFDTVTGIIDYTLGDGLGRTNINDYVFSFTTSDGAAPLFPLLDNAGNPVTSYNGSYNIYAPVKIESSAPGGGNPAGYTITGAVSSGTNTIYTYSGGTDVFTVGQEVFVGDINPAGFNFSAATPAFASKIITAATPNTFTVAFNTAAVASYQTGGVATGYAELTDDMTITVDLLPGPVNVITLTNQNYTGLTLKQALDSIVNSINTTTSYTALSVVVAGLPYIKIGVPGTIYTSAFIKFEGPNILTKGTPDIPQISQAISSVVATSSSVSYNNFLYASYFNASSTAQIIASDTTLVDPPVSYSHDIDTPIWTMALVDQIPPSTVYSLDHIVSGGDYSLNIAIDNTTGYSYTADNTTVSIYDGKIFIDSQDLSLLPLGPTTPIRLMEFNTVDNKLYVFVDGSTNNFHIVDPAPWNIDYTGTYGQTNYLKRGTITPWNNLTTGPTAAMGTITSAPTQPIPCSTMPCACIAGGPVAPPCPTGVPNWIVGRNDGVRSELFQDSTKNWPTSSPYNTGFFKVYNFNTQQLGFKTYYDALDPYYNLQGISGDTIAISAAVDNTLTANVVTYSSFASASGNAYGLFSIYLIVDYNENFTSRSWENTARYLIEGGRNGGSNGFIATPVLNPTYIVPDSYSTGSPKGEKQINSLLSLDGTSDYLLYEIKDGGTTYESSGNFVYVSLDGGIVETIDSFGNVTPIQLYKDFSSPSPSIPVEVPLQLVTDTLLGFVYGIARDARSTVDDMNIYILQGNAQYGVIDGASKWNIPISGQIAVDSITSMLYFTGKNTRNFYECNPFTGGWNFQVIPSVYEKMDGLTYGTSSPLSRMQGVIERVQGASYIGGGKFVVMNYMQQSFFTDLKYLYEASNLFVYDYTTNTVDQVLVGTGVSSYSGAPASYNPNRYAEYFGIADYNNDYCYGGLGIKVDSNGKIYWKKSMSDQIYMSESHFESGIAQIWGTGYLLGPANPVGGLIRIWNIQSDGSLEASKRTISDYKHAFGYIEYDSYNERIITNPYVGGSALSILCSINPRNLTGSYSTNGYGIGGLSTNLSLNGKQTTVYAVTVTPTNITYSVRPSGASINGIFPHQYAVGEVVKISNIISSPVDELNFPNSDTGPNVYATILSVTSTSFTIANTYGTTAVYVSGGRVIDAVWGNVYAANNFAGIAIDNKGSIIAIGSGSGAAGDGVPGYSNVGTTFVLNYGSNDLLGYRENPKVSATGIVSSPCVSTPDQLFRGLASITAGVARPTGQLSNAFLLHVPTQNTYWVMGSKNPACTITGITNAVYNSGTIRYFIPNTFTVGKVINIAGVIPSTYNLNRVTITNVDPAWFEISYTGTPPLPYSGPTPFSSAALSANYVIKVLDDTTLATVATIDLSFINELLDRYVNPDAFYGRFQYSEGTDEIYLYSNNSEQPVFVFSTITNSLIRSSSFKRMLSPYPVAAGGSNTIFTLENVNNIPYFSAYVAANSPSRFWFRLDLGDRTYQDDVHNVLNVSTTDVVGTTTTSYDIYNLTNMSDTFGQWKEITDTTWATIPPAISVTLGTRLEFVSFIINKPLVEIRNLTQATTFAITSISGLPLVTILIDGISIVSGDVLEFEFTNPANPSCPFINQTTITII